MESHLDNPVYDALISGDAGLGFGNGVVKYFDESVSPFAGFPLNYAYGFEQLYEELPAGRRILHATRNVITEPTGWEQKVYIKGSQFVFDITNKIDSPTLQPIPLKHEHAPEMVALAALTKPGPFDLRTMDFGHYHGFFENGKLVAMTGQRLHVYNYAEVSAVCTHPEHLGKGYATALLQHQLQLIINEGKIPFLHVRDDNQRAISVYERLGFKYNGPMHFYFLKSRKEVLNS
jgi:ribosomal protein S18 acetylase RimI-like enzyme